MTPNLRAFAILAAMLALSGSPPKPVDASPSQPAVIDRSAEVAALNADIAQLQAELADTKSALADAVHARVTPPQPVAAVSTTTAGHGAVRASGPCAARGPVFGGPLRRVFANRKPIRRLLGRG